MDNEKFSVTVVAETRKGLAARLAALSKEFGVEIKKNAKANEDEGAAEETQEAGEGNAAEEVDDDTIIKAFSAYKKRKGLATCQKLLAKYGVKQPSQLEQQDRVEVMEIIS
jgi:hypothetical protein